MTRRDVFSLSKDTIDENKIKLQYIHNKKVH